MFLGFSRENHGTRFYSNVNLAKGIVPYCVVQMLSQSWFTSSNFLIPAEYAVFHRKLDMCQDPKDMQIGAQGDIPLKLEMRVLICL